MEECQLIEPCSVMMVDEIDEAIKGAISFDNEHKLNGLYNLKLAQYLIFSTATKTTALPQ